MPSAYLIFDDTTPIAFIPSGVRGLWRQTHGCVLVVACPRCNADVGVFCTGVAGQPTSSTHYARRDAARTQLQTLRRQGPHVTIIIKPGAQIPAPAEEDPDVQPQA